MKDPVEIVAAVGDPLGDSCFCSFEPCDAVEALEKVFLTYQAFAWFAQGCRSIQLKKYEIKTEAMDIVFSMSVRRPVLCDRIEKSQ